VEQVLVCEDITHQALEQKLAENDETLFSASSDAGQALSILLGRHNSLGRADDTLYVKAYSGDPFRTTRISRKAVSLNSPCLSLLWFVQPDKLDSMLAADALMQGGFLARTMA